MRAIVGLRCEDEAKGEWGRQIREDEIKERVWRPSQPLIGSGSRFSLTHLTLESPGENHGKGNGSGYVSGA